MYFSNNSRYVLRKARFLSPNYLNKIGKNLSVKKPKDDPTKPPLRINIPDDDKDDFLQRNKNPVEVRTTSTSLSATFQDDVFRRSDIVSDFSNVESILMNNKVEESDDLRSSNRVSYTHRAINSEKLNPKTNVFDGVSFDSINNNNDNNIALGGFKKSAKNEVKGFEKSDHEKAWYVLVDVNPKDEETTVPENPVSRGGKHKEASWQRQNSSQMRPKTSKCKKSESLLHRSKHLSKFPLNKLNRKPSRFEVHEVEDEATYILYVKLDKQLKKKPCEVGYVPEREFTIRTGSNREHQEMSEGVLELSEPFDIEKGRKKQKSRKNEQVLVELDKGFQEPSSAPRVNTIKENVKSNQELSSIVEKARKSDSMVVKSDGSETSLRTHQNPDGGNQNPAVPAADTQNVYSDHSSAEQMPKAEPSVAVVDLKVTSTAPQEASTSDLISTPSEMASDPQAVSTPSQTSSTLSEVASTISQVTSRPSQKPSSSLKVSSRSVEVSTHPQEAPAPSQVGSVLFLDEGFPPPTEKQDSAIESQAAAAATAKTSEYSHAISEKACEAQKQSIVYCEKALEDQFLNTNYHKVQVDKSGIKGRTKIPVNQTNKKVPTVKQEREATPVSPEKLRKKDADDKKYLSIHEKSDDKPGKTGDVKSPPNIWRASQKDKNDSLNDVTDFQTCSSFVTIGRTEKYPVTFSAAFPPLLIEALNAHLRLKKNFNEKWKSLSKYELRSDSRINYLENSILFPKAESEEFDCESLFTTKEQIILNIIKNEEETHAKCTEPTKKSSIDSLTVMKKVKEMVQLDLDNAVKIFDERQGVEASCSSVVVLTENGWQVYRQELESQMLMRRNEMKLESMDFSRNILGDENKIYPSKYLPPKKGSSSEIHLPNEQIHSAVIFNQKTNEFFICKETLAGAISRKTNEPLSEITETLNFLARSSINSKDLKSGDSILVFDDETQSWKVDFSILEKRQQQLELEQELTKRSELILETFEELEKSQVTSVPRPDTKDKRTFDYVNKEWKDMKNPNKKSTKSKSPFTDSTSEEIRKKNSDLYENLFVAKKKDQSLNNPEKKAPGVSSSNSKKESKSANGGGSKEASMGGSQKSGPTSKDPEIPKSDSKLPPPPKPEKKEDDNFWEYFLKMNILPKDISEIQKAPPKPPKSPEQSKIDPKTEKPPLRIPNPFQPSVTKKETEKEIQKDISKKITPPPPSSDKIDKPSPKTLPLTSQITKEEPKKTDLPKQTPKIEVPKSEISKQPLKIDPPKSDTSKQPSKLDLPKQSPKVDPPKSDALKQPPKLDLPKQSPKVDPPKSDALKQPPKLDLPKQSPKVDPPKADPSKQPPKVDPLKSDISKKPSKLDLPKTDPSKPPPKADPPKPETPKEPPKFDPPKNPPKVDPPKPPSKSDPTKQPPKSDPPKQTSKTDLSKTHKAQDSKTPTGTKSASPPADHYVSDKIIEMSRMKGKEPSKISKIETVKVNLTPDTRLPSKITEINLNRKGKLPREAQTPPVGDKELPNDSDKPSSEEKNPLCKNFEKYKTPFSDPEYEDKPMKIKSDIVSNPNLKKLDNWNKTLVLHDVMKPPENIETWLKDETDKMATLLLKILQEASDGKPKRKQLPFKPKPGENQGKGSPKKQESTPESFLLRVRTVNFSLENGNKKSAEDIKSKIPLEKAKTAKPTNAPETKLPLEKSAIPSAAVSPTVKTYHLPASLEELRIKNSPWGGDVIGDFAPTPKESQHGPKLITDITDEIPGPEILKKISNTWKVLPVVDSQVTIFTLFRVFQLLNIGRSFLSPLNAVKTRRNAFSKLFSKYGPIVNVKGPLSGSVILIHKSEHLATVFEQDASIFVRSVFDSVEQIRKDSDQKLPCQSSSDWTSFEYADLKRATNDTFMRGCDRYLVPAEIAVNSLIGIIRKNRNLQDLVSEDFMNEIKRWSIEGLCSVLFEKSFGFMEGRIPNTYWVLEPDKLYEAIEKATECLNKCERGFQMWRLMPTPSAMGLSQAYRSMSSVLMKQVQQAGINLKSKNQLLKEGNVFRIRDLTFLESMLLNDGLSNEEINCNLIDILLIGSNMLNSVIGFLLYNLALNIRAQSKLFQELKEVMPTKHSNLDYNKLTSLKYLQACVKENFRLHMPIPVFNRLLQNDILLSNYFIPKGTYVVMDQRVAEQKEQLFEDPDSFSPERWLKGEKWMQDFEPFASFPLCHGPRAEFAKKVVELHLFTFMAKIIRNFQVEYHYGEIQNTNTLVNFPDKPLKFNFIERET